MYTRDRSTPQPDHFYVGSDSITGAAGSQVDGITTIVLERKPKVRVSWLTNLNVCFQI